MSSLQCDQVESVELIRCGGRACVEECQSRGRREILIASKLVQLLQDRPASTLRCSAGPLTVRLCLLRRCLVDAALLPAPAPELSPRHLARIPGPSLEAILPARCRSQWLQGRALSSRDAVGRQLASSSAGSTPPPSPLSTIDQGACRGQCHLSFGYHGAGEPSLPILRTEATGTDGSSSLTRLRRGGSQEWDGMRLRRQIAP